MRQSLQQARRIVIKLGTQVIRGEDGTPDLDFLGHVLDQVAQLRSKGRQVVLVCSGAVGAGAAALKLGQSPPPPCVSCRL